MSWICRCNPPVVRFDTTDRCFYCGMSKPSCPVQKEEASQQSTEVSVLLTDSTHAEDMSFIAVTRSAIIDRMEAEEEQAREEKIAKRVENSQQPFFCADDEVHHSAYGRCDKQCQRCKQPNPTEEESSKAYYDWRKKHLFANPWLAWQACNQWRNERK